MLAQETEYSRVTEATQDSHLLTVSTCVAEVKTEGESLQACCLVVLLQRGAGRDSAVDYRYVSIKLMDLFV